MDFDWKRPIVVEFSFFRKKDCFLKNATKNEVFFYFRVIVVLDWLLGLVYPRRYLIWMISNCLGRSLKL